MKDSSYQAFVNEEAVIIEEMKKYSPTTEEYKNLLIQLKEIRKMKAEEKPARWYQKLDPNTVFSGAISLVGMGLMLNFEKIGVITSKAFSWINKPKLK